ILYTSIYCNSAWRNGEKIGMRCKRIQARTPLLPHRPFVVVWNAPTESCRLRFKVERVFWNNMRRENCLTVKKYIEGPLGHYVINVTSAAKLCSKALCKKNGKCVRKSLNSGAYLHLNPCFFNIRLNHGIRGPRFHVSGHLNNHDILDMKHKFTCQCYQGWTGIYCEMPQITEPLRKLYPQFIS
uniref:hyaluronoglucosaminidase n=1 Tax=Sinocyclocheilus rhinocerous TaxID=307959 RepID=A0A673HSB6_9TELE